MNKPTCLFHPVEELLAEYRKYQYSILSAHQRLDFEYTTLKENNNVDIHCTPVCVIFFYSSLHILDTLLV